MGSAQESSSRAYSAAVPSVRSNAYVGRPGRMDRPHAAVGRSAAQWCSRGGLECIGQRWRGDAKTAWREEISSGRRGSANRGIGRAKAGPEQPRRRASCLAGADHDGRHTDAAATARSCARPSTRKNADGIDGVHELACRGLGRTDIVDDHVRPQLAVRERRAVHSIRDARVARPLARGKAGAEHLPRRRCSRRLRSPGAARSRSGKPGRWCRKRPPTP